MAGFNSDNQLSGVYQQINEIIAKYIGSLESSKIEESKRATQLAETAKSDQLKAETEILRLNNTITSQKTSISTLKTELENLENTKTTKQTELNKLEIELGVKKKELTSIQTSKVTSTDEITKASTELSKLSKDLEQKQVEYNQVISGLSTKQTELETLLTSVSNAQNESQRIERILKANEEIVSQLKESKLTLNKEISNLKKDKEGFESAKELAQKEYTEFIEDLEIKRKNANNTLSTVLTEIKTNSEKMKNERQVLENEQLFIKQVNELNAQKAKSLTYTKGKLQEMITELILEVDETRASELKSLLVIIEKL